MRSLRIPVLLLLASALASAAVSPLPVPAAASNGVTVGGGFLEAYSRQVVRTAANVVYIIAIDDNPCQAAGGGQGVIRVWKGSGAQTASPLIPTTFTEMDSAHHPTAGASGNCTYLPTYTLLSPDSRLDKSGVIHVTYIKPGSSTTGTLYYQTYNTATDLWGAAVQLATDPYITSGSGWPRSGQVAITLDANDIPFIAYASTSSIKSYNKLGGSWSSATTVYSSGLPNMHPSMATARDGTIHLAWIDAAIAPSTNSIVKYAKYSGSWGAAETVANSALANDNDDQGPSIATDTNNLPHVLYCSGTVSGADDYVRLKYRTAGGVWTDNTPSGAAGASNANGTWFAHTPQNYITAAGDEFVFLAHDANISPGPYQYQTGGVGNNWSAVFQMDPRNSTNTVAGAAGIDGSASIRWDPLRDNNPKIIDLLYYDENDGTSGYDHHATIYYKGVYIDSSDITANIWVNTSAGGTPSRSASLVIYNAANAYGSIAAAYAAATQGDVIRVRAGSYAGQTLARAVKGASVITILPDTGATVTLASLAVNTGYVTLQGMTSTGGCAVQPAGGQAQGDQQYVTLTNMHCKTLYFSSVHFSMIGGEIGPYDACNATDGYYHGGQEDGIASYATGGVRSSYILFDGVTVHDINGDIVPGSGAGDECGQGGTGPHVDCFQIDDVDNIIVRNSKFYNCATSDILSRPYQSTISNFTLENNWFGPTIDGGNGVLLGSVSEDALGGSNVVRYNTILGPGLSQLGTGTTQVYGNILSNAECTHGTYGYNVFITGGMNCGTNKKVGSVAFVSNPGAGWLTPAPDLHLANGATLANNAGDPANAPAADIDGGPRNSPSDAGADEYGSGSGTLSVTTSSLTGGMAGVAYSQSLSAAGGTPPYTWAIASGSLTSCSLSISSAGAITGTPSSATTCTFTARVTDSASVTATSGSLSIVVAAGLSVTTGTPLAVGTVGSAYSQSLAASGGTSPYTWSISSGSLAACGLSLSAAGAVTGTPGSATTCNFTARVTDTNSFTATKALSVTINSATTAPTITSPSPLPGGTVGMVYNVSGYQFTGTGSPAPTWSATGVPGGLSLSSSGALTGTPSTPGTFTIAVTAANGTAPDATGDFSITISAAQTGYSTLLKGRVTVVGGVKIR